MRVRQISEREVRVTGDGVEAVVLLHPDGVEVGQFVAPGMTRAEVEGLVRPAVDAWCLLSSGSPRI